jgi:hypothetical protein
VTGKSDKRETGGKRPSLLLLLQLFGATERLYTYERASIYRYHTRKHPREGTTYGHKTKEVLSLALLLTTSVAPGRLWLYRSGQRIHNANTIAHARSGDRDTIYRSYELPG